MTDRVRHTYIETLGVSLDCLVLKTVVDAWGRQEGTTARIWVASLPRVSTLLLDLISHELDRRLRVPVLIHLCVLRVSRQKPIQALYHFC